MISSISESELLLSLRVSTMGVAWGGCWRRLVGGTQEKSVSLAPDLLRLQRIVGKVECVVKWGNGVKGIKVW